jgi:steroid 5-alpha reductase family enzyme
VLPFTGAREPSQLIASLLVLLWAIRLAGYLFRRILQMKVDHRFDAMRDKPLRFTRFWLLQAVAVAVIMLPVSYPLDRSVAPSFGTCSEGAPRVHENAKRGDSRLPATGANGHS